MDTAQQVSRIPVASTRVLLAMPAVLIGCGVLYAWTLWRFLDALAVREIDASLALYRASVLAILFIPIVVAVVWIVHPPSFLLSKIKYSTSVLLITGVALVWAVLTPFVSYFLGA